MWKWTDGFFPARIEQRDCPMRWIYVNGKVLLQLERGMQVVGQFIKICKQTNETLAITGKFQLIELSTDYDVFSVAPVQRLNRIRIRSASRLWRYCLC